MSSFLTAHHKPTEGALVVYCTTKRVQVPNIVEVCGSVDSKQVTVTGLLGPWRMTRCLRTGLELPFPHRPSGVLAQRTYNCEALAGIVICIYTHMYIHIYVHTYIYIYVHIYMCIYMYMYIYIYTYTYIYISVHVFTYT